MKKIISVILIFYSICTAFAQSVENNKLKISFNDFFKKDTISLKINKNEIISNLVITSRESIGFADLDVTILDCNKVKIYNKVIVSNTSTVSNKELILKRKLKFKSIINLSLTLNGKKQEFKIDLKKGKYIGLSKDDVKAEFILSQSEHSFEYD
ncbi:hypothetical protein SAMN05421664_1494 [Chryseobacterium soldanellicola]|uniref:Auto-transporter adhesin head GIN domain-containing protein n=1 Tax=Chryseobacterium soldanellicola TaxID=311333 RepID=A0A1H1AMW5_9FLAO|nr:hypothetical protein [Chryseobacterium soldanellicola]SDQ40841.1 hypothetical protein SAMN05421664_1494 [Chryseobacterium soldanellicola]